MLSFDCDYNNGAHPDVLRRLLDTNAEPTLTYGADHFSQQAKEKIRQACQAPEADVCFLAGGTQTNLTVIDAMLASFEAVIAADTGHINVHEATAIEATGHKVIALPHTDGKLAADTLETFMQQFEADESREHTAQPALVYISFPTELGTLYSHAELQALRDVCQRHALQLFIDGARLGYGLASAACDVALPQLAALCDAFYIGGTKVGALCGEAVVFPRGNAPRHFFTIVKRRGALLAKGRTVGVQFDALFSDGLYARISAHAIAMAGRLRELLRQKGYPFYIDSPTNQQFVVISNADVARLEQQVLFTHWGPADEGHTICRFVTSWATTDADLDALARLLGVD